MYHYKLTKCLHLFSCSRERTVGGVMTLYFSSHRPFLFHKYDVPIQAKRSFAPCIDLKVAKFLEDETAAEKR